ncbi:MAG: histidine kinase [Bacteroidales bacterium]|nr:histidine kinase [Bacteroidales bacterium]
MAIFAPMRKPSAILSLLQRYSTLFSWIAIYVTFYLASLSHQTPLVAWILTNSTFVPMLIVWAIIHYYLAPRTLHKRRVTFYVTCLVMVLLISTLASKSDLALITRLHEKKLMQFSADVEAAIKRGENQQIYLQAKYIFLLLSTMAVTTVSWLLDERKRLNRMQREHRARLELKYLRAQINPHFLFNALNCIYALTLSQDEKAPEAVMKLSEMLRYVNDDCHADKVTLQKEISYVRNYIDFQLIRMERQPDITFDCVVADVSAPIPPMIFQPMVENCFKHSQIGNHPDGFIHITLRQDERGLTFVAENSKPTLPQLSEDHERTGIGLQNVEQRLHLMYGENATLTTQETDTNYRIEVCIKS